MGLFNIFAVLVTMAALFSYANYKVLKLPKTVGLMLISLTVSVAVMILDRLGFGFRAEAETFVRSIHFGDTVLKGVLCLLLFAGSLHIDFRSFMEQKWPIASLATLGVVLSTVFIGFGAYALLPLIGCPVPLPLCMLFGALISPTDPVAVLALLKSAKVPKSMEMQVAGESLLNDGVGVVVFAVIADIFRAGGDVTVGDVFVLLLHEAVGGIAFGLALGYAAFLLIKRVDDYQVEILLSLALVFGGYALASELHVSGPLAMVAAGLFIGNYGRANGMSDLTRQHLDNFWEVLDDILNAVLFVLVGLEALLLNVKAVYFVAAATMIPLVLVSRFASVWLSASVSGLVEKMSGSAKVILTWGGLRGGISFALALSLPVGTGRDAIILITYGVVVFSVLVQGLTMRPLLRALKASD